MIRTRAEKNEIENRKMIEKINETKNQFFKKIKKLANLHLEGLRKKERGLKLLKPEMKVGTLLQILQK